MEFVLYEICFIILRLTYPETIKIIHNLGEETIINTAIDFNKSFKPKFMQLALIPAGKDGKLASPITFDMEYKESSSKAAINIVIINFKYCEYFIFYLEFEKIKTWNDQFRIRIHFKTFHFRRSSIPRTRRLDNWKTSDAKCN